MKIRCITAQMGRLSHAGEVSQHQALGPSGQIGWAGCGTGKAHTVGLQQVCSCVCERVLRIWVGLCVAGREAPGRRTGRDWVGSKVWLAQRRPRTWLWCRGPMVGVLQVPDSMSRLFRRGSWVAAPWVRSTAAQGYRPPLPSSSTHLRAFQHSTPSPATPRRPVLSSKLYFQIPAASYLATSSIPGHASPAIAVAPTSPPKLTKAVHSTGDHHHFCCLFGAHRPAPGATTSSTHSA